MLDEGPRIDRPAVRELDREAARPRRREQRIHLGGRADPVEAETILREVRPVEAPAAGVVGADLHDRHADRAQLARRFEHLGRPLEQPREGRERQGEDEVLVRQLLAACEPHAAILQVERLDPRAQPDLSAGEVRGQAARERLDPALAGIPECRIVSRAARRDAQRAPDDLVQRRPGDEAAAPFRRQLLARDGEQLAVVGRKEMARESVAQVALDELGGVAQRALAQLPAALAEGGFHESHQALRHRPRRQAVQVVLVGKFAPHTFTVDKRASLDGEQVVAQPAVLDQPAHLRVAGVEPMPRPVEGKSLHPVGPDEPPEPVLGLEQREGAAELPRAGEPREPPAGDDGVGARHRSTHLPRHPRDCPSKMSRISGDRQRMFRC